MPTFSERSQRFLSEFFVRQGSRAFYPKAFEEPCDYPDLLEAFMPGAAQKVVLVDGHPRTGKTWAAAAAAAVAVDRADLQPDQWWTGSEDSINACDIDDTLDVAVGKVLSRLNENIKLLLLDDFLGTNLPRELGKVDDRLRSFFHWNSDNPWLQAVSSECVIIMVERSAFFALSEIRLGVDIRSTPTPGMGRTRPEVTRIRHGIFRGKSQGLFGAFDEERLRSLSQKNLANHPLRNRSGAVTGAMLDNAPLVAFSQPELNAELRKVVSWTLFGNDLTTISRAVEGEEGAEPADPSSQRELDLTYLTLIAPALVFLDAAAYNALGIGEEKAKEIRSSFYLDEGDSGRLPNEFYVGAVREHLPRTLPLVARVALRVTRRLSGQPKRGIGLVLRGILERILEMEPELRSETYADLDREDSWRELRSELDRRNDVLLHLEGSRAAAASGMTQALEPGLAAALGWLRYKFPDTERNETIRSLFEAGLKNLVADWQASPTGGNWDRVIGAFSSWLQWAIRGWREGKDESSELEAVRERWSTLPEKVKDRLGFVLEDELIWGEIYRLPEGAEPRESSIAKQTLQFMEPGDHGPASPSQQANRVFTLAWHNEWKPIAARAEPGNQVFAGKLKGYYDAIHPATLDQIRAEPQLLDDNLQYHWVHFVTQHAVWMRQWCFELNPDETEFRRAAPGSKVSADNRDLGEIFLLLLQQHPPAARVRNGLFLAGCRAARIPDFSRLTSAIDSLLATGGESVESAVLQAMFELMRQGYYRPGTVLDTWSQAKWRQLEAWRTEAWKSTWPELKRLSHKYDVLPPEEEGWNLILPEHW